MSLFDDFLIYEFCVPGGIFGTCDVDCPDCGTTLTLDVTEPDGEEPYACDECGLVFEVDWREGVVR